MNPQITRVEWNDFRRGEITFRIIAERNGLQWEFWEKDIWEVRWYRLDATPGLIAMAEELNKQRCQHHEAAA
jgi:hypothetical protein